MNVTNNLSSYYFDTQSTLEEFSLKRKTQEKNEYLSDDTSGSESKRSKLTGEEQSTASNLTPPLESSPETNFSQTLIEIFPVMKEKKDFEQKLNYLKEFMTTIEDEDSESSSQNCNNSASLSAKKWWEGEIQLISSQTQQPCHLELIVIEEPFDSNTLSQKEIDPQGTENSSYLYFKVYEKKDENRETPLLMIRSSIDGQIGEILHIGALKGHLSGNQLKDQLCNPLCEAIGLKTIYLNDQSKISLPFFVKKNENKETGETPAEIFLRFILPIAKEDGQTWYGRDGYVPISKHNIQSVDFTLVSQNASIYFAAIAKIRNTLLSDLHKEILSGDPESKYKLIKLYQRYLNGQNKTFTTKRDNSPYHYRVYDLAKAMFEAQKSKIEEDNRYLFDFYETCLCFWILPEQASPEQITYNLALDVIRRTQFWVKNSADPKPLSYKSYLSNSHQSFDEIVSESVEEYDIRTWDQLVQQNPGKFFPNPKKASSHRMANSKKARK